MAKRNQNIRIKLNLFCFAYGKRLRIKSVIEAQISMSNHDPYKRNPPYYSTLKDFLTKLHSKITTH